ncbi:MAG: hypothetical protein FWC16_07480 [Defluviitaleaceae bacterium]|nr:hypothetical protein [Defluviitaleaceae bacterium]MCL2274755.1 hypothetical protein [Defluviitaleaceae bacterium]
MAQSAENHGNVLIADTLKSNLYILAGLLKPHNLHAETVLNGADALARVQNGSKYKLIFINCHMPNASETAQKVRPYCDALIGISDDDKTHSEYDAIITRPIDINVLETVLSTYLKGKSETTDARLHEAFASDGQKTVTLMQGYVNNGLRSSADIVNFTVAAHGIKSALRNVGEADLSHQAAELEAAGNRSDTAYILQAAPNFVRALQALVTKYTPRQQKTYATQDAPNLAQNLQALAEKCAEYNRKGALDMLAGMTYGTQKTLETLDQIKSYLLSTDFDEAEKTARDYLASI